MNSIDREPGLAIRSPRALTVETLNTWPPAPGIPYLGPERVAALDEKYERVDRLFVDRTGFDDEGPALSTAQFRGKLRELAAQHGTILVGVANSGQFQCYCNVWKKRRAK